MLSLQEVSETFWLQMGGGSDESRVTLEEIIATAQAEYAWQLLQLAWKEKRDEGGSYTVPSEILSEDEITVVNNEADIAILPIMRSVPWEQWLGQIGDLTCDCKYIKSTLNLSQILCDDDSMGNVRTYYVVGNKIKFPQGTHSNKLPIIYANDGTSLDSQETFIPDAISALVRERLGVIYLGKVVPADTTNNSNPNP